MVGTFWRFCRLSPRANFSLAAGDCCIFLCNLYAGVGCGAWAGAVAASVGFPQLSPLFALLGGVSLGISNLPAQQNTHVCCNTRGFIVYFELSGQLAIALG